MIRIRLRRVGKKHHPYYRMVVANQPEKRDGDFLETSALRPSHRPALVVVDAEKAKAWIGKGAQPSEAADKIAAPGRHHHHTGARAALRKLPRPAAAAKA